MKMSLQLGRVMGIPIKLHFTFLLVLPFFSWIFASDVTLGFGLVKDPLLRYSLGTVAAVLLFVCVLLHELGHSFVAKRHGAVIQNITLFLIGGVSSMEEIPRNPKVELKMALAGPLVSFFIGVFSLAGVSIFNSIYLPPLSPYIRLVWIIGWINIVLFVFNLLPAFPMDGGRVLRAWLAQHISYIQATHVAASIGKLLAVLMGITGLIAPNPWLIFIALFVYVGASEEEKATVVSVKLEHVKVGDIMSTQVVSVPPDMSVEELVDFMFRHKHMGYPVMDGERILGIVTLTDVQKVPRERRREVRVRDVMSYPVLSVSSSEKADRALRLISGKRVGRVLVVDGDRLTGIISRTDLIRALELLN